MGNICRLKWCACAPSNFAARRVSPVFAPRAAAELGIIPAEELALRFGANPENSARARSGAGKPRGNLLEKSIAIGNRERLGASENLVDLLAAQLAAQLQRC
jgi:hypothetical protein